MTAPTADITLDVDLRNPGQFFACCGVLELASRVWAGSEAWFARDRTHARFQVATHGADTDPLGDIVRKLCESEPLVALADDHEAQAQADRKPVVILPFGLRLDWWLDSYRHGSDKSELKVWAGQQAPTRNLNGLQESWREIVTRDPRRLFSQRCPSTGRFGFDPSSAWESLDVGFSPDEQGVPVQTAPATEILAAIGLQRCRPRRAGDKNRWFVYRAWADPMEIAVAPAAITGAGRAIAAYEFPVVMRNAQYGSFGWARPREEQR